MIRKTVCLCIALGLVPALGQAAPGERFGPERGERELTLAGTGSSDRKFDNGNVGISGDVGWYLRRDTLLGIRQSVNYANIEGESLQDDFWNGASRGFGNYHFNNPEWRAKPFAGASLGLIYGDGVDDTGFAGLEGGVKYYVRPKTFIMGRAEYQWFFDRASDADNTFDDGAWAYTAGIGYHF